MKHSLHQWLLILGLLLFAANVQGAQRIYRIMPVGDSIIESFTALWLPVFGKVAANLSPLY